jgi:ribosome modulation factor
LRSAEREHYQATGGDFRRDEKAYRRGYEAGMAGRVLDPGESDAFKRGYERGTRSAKNVEAR